MAMQVIGVKLVLKEGETLFERDPEGLELAAAINAHLPVAVRVRFSTCMSMMPQAGIQCHPSYLRLQGLERAAGEQKVQRSARVLGPHIRGGC